MSNQLVPIQDRINAAYAAGYQAGYQAGIAAGVQEMGDVQVKYLHPLLQDVANLSNIVSLIRGVALAGFGQVQMAMIKEFAGDFVRAWARVDMEIARAEQSGFYEDVRGAFYLERYQPIYAACKSYYSQEDPDGKQLRALAAQTVLDAPQNLLEFRKLGAGAPRRPQVSYIAREAEKLLKSQNLKRNNKNYVRVGRLLYESLAERHADLVGEEKAAYLSFQKECIDKDGCLNERWLGDKIKNAVRQRKTG